MNKNENAKKMREYYQKLEDERNEWERKREEIGSVRARRRI